MTSITESHRSEAVQIEDPSGPTGTQESLPWANLLALALATFVTVLTEALPAGILPLMSSDLAVSEALIGQLVSVYAIGTLLTAIPLATATQRFRRRPILLTAIAGFAVVNLVTAVSTNYLLTAGARFAAGVFAGLLWALVAGYAVRMVPEHLKGRAMTIAMVGIPLALSIGIPAFTILASSIGWRMVFGLLSLLAGLLLIWSARLPDFPGRSEERRLSLTSTATIPGIRPVLFATFAYVLAHNILYTYIAPFLTRSGLDGQVGHILLAFGVIALASIWSVGILIDRWLRELVLGSIALFIAAALVFGLQGDNAAAVITGILAWGLAWGGAASLFQTASAKAAGEAADVAQSMIVTVWNLAMAIGGIAGGLLLERAGSDTLPWVLLPLLLFTLIVVGRARRHGFPNGKRHAQRPSGS